MAWILEIENALHLVLWQPKALTLCALAVILKITPDRLLPFTTIAPLGDSFIFTSLNLLAITSSKNLPFNCKKKLAK